MAFRSKERIVAQSRPRETPFFILNPCSQSELPSAMATLRCFIVFLVRALAVQPTLENILGGRRYGRSSGHLDTRMLPSLRPQVLQAGLLVSSIKHIARAQASPSPFCTVNMLRATLVSRPGDYFIIFSRCAVKSRTFISCSSLTSVHLARTSRSCSTQSRYS